ncbi:MAG: hypothetical protein NUV87_01165 [Candidatus Roizmanbacteria bacterium]|nr:hypothetical protein [Candidatus Roizmanbacteria bacterium]
MYIPDIFKFFSLISAPLFGVIALSIVKNTPDFSLSKHTISKSVYFIKHPIKIFMFRLNFIIKAVLDIGFILYLASHLKLSLYSPIPTLMILSAILFGSLSYFIMGKYTTVHRIIVFTYGIMMGLAGIWLAQMTGNINFVRLTVLLVILSNFLMISFFLAKRINVFIQVICMSLLYSWLLLLVFRYL